MPRVTVKKYQRTVDPAGTDPGAAAEIVDLERRKEALAGLEPTKPKLGNPVKQIGGAVAAVVKRVTPRTEHTPAEEQTFKMRGQRAFYEGKIDRRRRNSTGNRMSPTTRKDEGY